GEQIVTTSISRSLANMASIDGKKGTLYASIPSSDRSRTSHIATNCDSSFRTIISACRLPIWPQPTTANFTLSVSFIPFLAFQLPRFGGYIFLRSLHIRLHRFHRTPDDGRIRSSNRFVGQDFQPPVHSQEPFWRLPHRHR